MPVVFVHGVNTRTESPSYESGTLATEAFLQRHLEGARIDGKTLAAVGDVHFPYWGDLGSRFAWDMASLPSGRLEALGSSDDPTLDPLAAQLWDGTADALGDEPLAQLAQDDFAAAVDVVVHLALTQVREGEAKEAAAFAVAASAYATRHAEPEWLAEVDTDDQFLADLQDAVASETEASGGAAEALGGGRLLSGLKGAVRRVRTAAKKLAGSVLDRAGDFASTRVLAATRPALNETLGRFFGDIFIYFDGRGTAGDPGPITARLLAAFDAARTAAPADEPFVIIGHSLGGVITYDLLTHFRPDLAVDLFVTVGSQVAHFEELKLFHVSDPAVVPPQKAPKPPGVGRWINVYDAVDIFSYAASPVFDGVDVDAEYDTGTYVIKAHGAFFEQDRFYERLRARIDGLPS